MEVTAIWWLLSNQCLDIVAEQRLPREQSDSSREDTDPRGPLQERSLKSTENPNWRRHQCYGNREVFTEGETTQIWEVFRKHVIDTDRFCSPRMGGIISSLDSRDREVQSAIPQEPESVPDGHHLDLCEPQCG